MCLLLRQQTVALVDDQICCTVQSEGDVGTLSAIGQAGQPLEVDWTLERFATTLTQDFS